MIQQSKISQFVHHMETKEYQIKIKITAGERSKHFWQKHLQPINSRHLRPELSAIKEDF